MSIATDITVNIEINMQTVDTFGLSKTLDNYSTEELQEALYCAMYNPARRNNVLRTTEYGWVGAFDKDNGVFQWPFKIQPSGSTYIWDSGASSEGYNTPEGLYSGVIWLRRESNVPESVITVDTISEYRMVTEWNVNKFVFNVPSLSTVYTEVSSADWAQKTYPCCYVPEGWGSMVYHTNRGEVDDETANVNVYPYSLFIYEDKLFLHAIKIEAGFIYNSTQEVYTKVFGDSGHLSIDKSTTIATSYNNDYLSVAQSGGGYNKNYSLSGYPGNDRFPVAWAGPGGYTIWTQVGCDDEQRYLTLWEHSGYSNIGGYIRIHSYFSRVDDVLLYFANMGVYFYTDKLYKPIIEDKIVTGYTDELSTTSDIDNWDGDAIHDVPITPPVPPEPSEDAEPETFGWGGNEVAGMVRYYLLSQAEMESLQAYMSNPNWRMDYRNCIIGMYVVPNGGLFFDAPVATTLKFRIGLNETGGAIPQDQELDTGISCLRISGVVNNDNAVIEIPRINGNFLDFEPYSKYMVYIPFCGVIPLPDYVAGKEIKVTIYPDVPTCTCTAVVSSQGRKIATAKGAYGSQLPVTSDGDGLKAASVINSLGNFIMGAGEVALGIGTGMVPLAIAGGAQMLGSGLQTDLQLGQAFGYSIGASGDTSFFGAGNRCEYYVAYSKWNNPDGEDTNIYGHTYGFVCNKRGLLNDFDGFTVCDNPHVYGFSCTSDEKDEIERLLREGIIIHKPEE